MSLKEKDGAQSGSTGASRGDGDKGRRIVFDDSGIKSSYANVCTATSTREEVVLNFGVNQAWERSPEQMKVELTHRIVLSPFAAMRLLQVLTRLMSEYQARYGELRPDPIPQPLSPEK